jgi:hypothetical protein
MLAGLAGPDTTYGNWELKKRTVFFEPNDYSKSYYSIIYCDTCKMHNLILFDAETKERESDVQIWAFNKSGLSPYCATTDSNGIIYFSSDIDSILIIGSIFHEKFTMKIPNSISFIQIFRYRRRLLSPMSNVWYLKSRKKIQEKNGLILLRRR